MLVVQFSNNRGPWGELDRRVVDVRSGLADDLEEFRDEPEVIGGGVEKWIDIGGCLNLTFELASEATSNSQIRTHLVQPFHSRVQRTCGITHDTKNTQYLQPKQKFLLKETA